MIFLQDDEEQIQWIWN